MRFQVDECSGPAIADWLRSQGHDVFSVYDSARGQDDDKRNKLKHQNRKPTKRYVGFCVL